MGLFDGALNKVGGLFGLGGGQGEYYSPSPFQSASNERLQQLDKLRKKDEMNKLINGLSSGKLSLQEVLAGINKDMGDEQAAALGVLASSPVAGTELATQQVRENDLTKDLFGDKGMLERVAAEEKNLSERGYSLQPEDYEAYGQASDNIARDFGAQEASLSQALADRGLAAAPNGAAASSFSGLYGNKFEQLASMQRKIADDRMKNTMQRLAETRSAATSLGNLGLGAQQQFYDQNTSAHQRYIDQLNTQANRDLTAHTAQEDANQKSMASKAANRKLGLGDAVSRGIFSGTEGAVKGLFTSGGNYASGKIFPAS